MMFDVHHLLGFALRFEDIFDRPTTPTSLPVRAPLQVSIPALHWQAFFASSDSTYRFRFGPHDAVAGTHAVEVTSLDGQVTDVTAEAKVTSLEQACCPAQTCCAKAQSVTVHRAVAFTQAVQTVAFAPVDAGPLDAGAPLDGAAVDTTGDDAPMIGTPDVSEPIGADIDAAFVDDGALDALVDI